MDWCRSLLRQCRSLLRQRRSLLRRGLLLGGLLLRALLGLLHGLGLGRLLASLLRRLRHDGERVWFLPTKLGRCLLRQLSIHGTLGAHFSA